MASVRLPAAPQLQTGHLLSELEIRRSPLVLNNGVLEVPAAPEIYGYYTMILR